MARSARSRPKQRSISVGLFTPDIAIKHEYWRLLAAMFLHQGLFHVGINMLSLYFIGSVFEEVAGRGKFLALYLVSGLAGNVSCFCRGARVLGDVGGVNSHLRHLRGVVRVRLPQPQRLPEPSAGQLAFWMTLNLVITFTNASISWQGHIGGLIGGVATVELLTRFGRRPRCARRS